ncbi:MAG TPA: CHAP domain-containing protein [Gaiellaceae bacterium]
MGASPGRRALAEALRHVGVRESPPGSNCTMFGRWFGRDGVPWCAIFASYSFDVGAGVVLCRGWHGAGVGPRGVAYVPTLAAWLRATGRAVDAPQPGDLAVFDWDGGLPDHVGIVIRARGAGVLETVEGNTAVGNDSDGGEVMRRERRVGQVAVFGRLT